MSEDERESNDGLARLRPRGRSASQHFVSSQLGNTTSPNKSVAPAAGQPQIEQADLDMLEKRVLGAVRGAVTGVMADRAGGTPAKLDLDLDFAIDEPGAGPEAAQPLVPTTGRSAAGAVLVVDEPRTGPTAWVQFILIVAGSLTGVVVVAAMIWLVPIDLLGGTAQNLSRQEAMRSAPPGVAAASTVPPPQSEAQGGLAPSNATDRVSDAGAPNGRNLAGVVAAGTGGAEATAATARESGGQGIASAPSGSAAGANASPISPQDVGGLDRRVENEQDERRDSTSGDTPAVQAVEAPTDGAALGQPTAEASVTRDEVRTSDPASAEGRVAALPGSQASPPPQNSVTVGDDRVRGEATVAAPAPPMNADMIRYAQQWLANGEVRRAREAFRTTMDTNPIAATLGLARSYDPNYLASLAGADASADVDEATRLYHEWYRLSVEAGLVSESAPVERIIRAMRRDSSQR